ncbi:hypothetical protein ACP6EK_03875 [Candidatus Caldatribacterium sp. SIUC1]|uniref:hypothetical protein n=1 Tax=Candidatus Caldatribacterium sp. SIUC1 TaxID=3418365 RepID=UPI003F69477B
MKDREKKAERSVSFREKVQQDFPSFWLFREILSPPASVPIHPLFRWRARILRRR